MGQYISPDIVTGTYCRARLVVDYTTDASNNCSYVSAYVQMWRTNSGYTTYGTGKLYIGVNGYGVEASNILSSQRITQNSYTQIGSTRSLTIEHDGTGRWSGDFSIYTVANVDNMVIPNTVFRITLAPIPVYTLSVSAGAGSNISVNRTSSYGNTGYLNSGEHLYYDDMLKISFLPDANHSIDTHTVNGATFSSGSTYTVSGNVSIISSAIPLKSAIAATDANIGSVSTILVTRYNPSYTHSITYSFGLISGTICTKSSDTSIAWTIPNEFYTQIPNAKAGTCTLTITTYDEDISLGSDTCTLTVTVSQAICEPTIVGSVTDINEDTVSLTGDNSVLIRYKSTALCTLTATPKNYATIQSQKIGGSPVSGSETGGIVTATKTYTAVSVSSFDFSATDSRGYSVSTPISPTVIEYIQLTCNPLLNRPTPAGGEITMTLSGNFYRGSFGEYSNTLTVRYRYREADAAFFSTWNVVPASDYTIGTKSYSTNGAVSLGDNFNYRKSYVFQVQVYDGANGVTLSSVTQTVTVRRGMPIFDWGENDFAFHVPISIEGNNLVDYIIEAGTDDVWEYRKWASGLVECWARCDYSELDIDDASGSAFMATVLADSTLDFPVVFDEKPEVFVTNTSTNYNGAMVWLVSSTDPQEILQSCPGVMLWRHTAATGVNGYISLYVRGHVAEDEKSNFILSNGEYLVTSDGYYFNTEV